MASLALRPRSPSEIVDTAFQILRAHYGQFVLCSALAYTPWLIVQLVVLGDPRRFTALPWYVGAVSLLGVWITFSLMSAVLISCASQAYLGEGVDVGVAVRTALSRLPTVIVAALFRYILLVFGLMALVVGALYVFARFFAVAPVIILERAGVATAFARSSALSKGRKWHVLNTLGLVGAIYWVLGFGIAFGAALSGSFIVQVVAGATYTILAYPVIAITETLLYYDARIKSEGLDIELMAEALGPAPREAPAH
jgi:hypothetical protein